MISFGAPDGKLHQYNGQLPAESDQLKIKSGTVGQQLGDFDPSLGTGGEDRTLSHATKKWRL